MSVDQRPARLLVRADASPAIGSGHVARCLALAGGWLARGGRATLASAEITPALVKRAADHGADVVRLDVRPGSAEDRGATANVADRVGADWIVLDGYAFDLAFQRSQRQPGRRVLVIDDVPAAPRIETDLLVNQNLHARPEDYADRLTAGTESLLGPVYALLPPEFAAAGGRARREPERAARLLISLGGGDVTDPTLLVLDAIARIDAPRFQATVLAGAGDAVGLRGRTLELHHSVAVETKPVDTMAKLLSEADMAIVGGGVGSLEAACVGAPAFLIVRADNQAPNAAALERAGAAVSLGRFEALSPEIVARSIRELAADPSRRAAMSAAGRRIVDGLGVDRVVSAMLNAQARFSAPEPTAVTA